MAMDRNRTFNRQPTALDLAAMRALDTPELNDLSELTSALQAMTAFAWHSLRGRAFFNPARLENLGRTVTAMRTARSLAGH